MSYLQSDECSNVEREGGFRVVYNDEKMEESTSIIPGENT